MLEKAKNDTRVSVEDASTSGKMRITIDMSPETYELFTLWAESEGITVDAILEDYTK